MSTRINVKLHSEEDGSGFHLYRECLDFDEEFIYLEVWGVPFETESSMSLSGKGVNSFVIRLPDDWARKLGLVAGRKARRRHGEKGERTPVAEGGPTPSTLQKEIAGEIASRYGRKK